MKALSWSLLTFLEGWSMIITDTDRHITGAAAESFTSWCTGCRQRGRLGLAWALEISKSTPWDTPTPTRPHLFILSEQFHYLLRKCPNVWDHGGHSHSNHHTLLALPHEIKITFKSKFDERSRVTSWHRVLGKPSKHGNYSDPRRK